MGSCLPCLSTKDKSGNKKKPQDKNATIDPLYADITNIDLGQELLNQNKIKEKQNLTQKKEKNLLIIFSPKI